MRAFVLSTVVIAVAGCSTLPPLRMQLPQALQGVAPLEVHGRDPSAAGGAMAFGRWRARVLDDRGVRSMQLDSQDEARPNRSIGYRQAHRRYRIELTSAEANVRIDCRAQSRSLHEERSTSRDTDTTEVFLPGDVRLQCAFVDDVVGALQLRRATSVSTEQETGEFVGADRRWVVQSINHFENETLRIPSDRYGYQVLADGKVVAAVETVNQGRVWFASTLSVRDQEIAAALAAALLMYDPALVEVGDPG